MTDKQFLQKVCRECKKANGKCIKNEIYIGLCSVNDKEELLEIHKGIKNA